MTNLEIALIEMLGQDWAQHVAFETGGEYALRTAFVRGAMAAADSALDSGLLEAMRGVNAILDGTIESQQRVRKST
jgi:hypothetical protein